MVVFILAASFGSSQESYHLKLNDENGLPSNEVYKIVQDKKGYIWIGCDAGLYRYNGFSFKEYKHQKQNARSMSYLYFDKKNRLWCANFSGQIFCIVHDSIKMVADYSNAAGKYHFCFTEEGGFWKIDQHHISLIDSSGIEKKRYPLNLNNEIIGNGTDMVHHHHTLWIEIPQLGLCCFDEKTEKFSIILPSEKEKKLYNQRLFVFRDNLYLIRIEQYKQKSIVNLYAVDAETKKVTLITRFDNPNQRRYYSFFEDNQQKLWVGSSSGALRMNEVSELNGKYETYYTKNKISCVMQDKEGNYWLGDLQNGIKIVPELDIKIYTHYDSEGKADMDITCLKNLNDDVLIIGHYDGSISIMNTKNNTIDELEISDKIKGITVKDIETHQENIYVSRGHLLKYNINTGTAFCPEIFGNARDMVIVGDSIYAVHPEYLSRFSVKDIQAGKPLPYQKFHAVGGRKAIYENTTQTIYFALNNGLYAYHHGNFEVLKYKGENIYAYSFTQNKNSIWVATQTQGILEIQNRKIIRRFLQPKELEDITAKSLYADEKYLWACTNSHFVKINLVDGKWYSYSLTTGINPRDVTAIEKCGNHIYIGTKKSLIKVPWQLEPENKISPQLFLETISVHDGIIPQKNNFELPYNFSNLKIEFVAFSYKSYKNLTYQYRLLGFDTTWVKLDYDKPYTLYSSLPASTYTYQVKAVNESGLSGNTHQIIFTVKKPLWQKAWFYVLSTMMTVLLVLFFARYQIRKIRRRNEIEKKMIMSQLSALKAQMNPHFMYNALNSIQALILQQDIKNSNLYLSKFSYLMRKILDASGKETITLKEELDILSLYLDLEKLRFGQDFIFEITVDSNIDEYAVRMPAMIIQPFVENALKHGLLHKKGKKSLNIDFKTDNHSLYCHITDNGIGRKKAEEIKQRLASKHQSFATEATEKRLELLSKYSSISYKITITDLYDEQKQPCGTKVSIAMPF